MKKKDKVCGCLDVKSIYYDKIKKDKSTERESPIFSLISGVVPKSDNQ